MLSRLLVQDWPAKVARAKPAVGGTRKLLTTTAVCGIRKNLTKPAVGGKRQKITPVVKESIASSVHESDWDHWQRHSPQPESHPCGRCNFIREKAEFLRNYPWLEPRPLFIGGRLEVWLQRLSLVDVEFEKGTAQRPSRMPSTGLCVFEVSSFLR